MVLSIFRRSLRAGSATTGYPEVADTPPESCRGQVTLATARCSGDGACARVCPSQAITVETTGSGWTWQLDDSRCVFCGLCVEACPEGALRSTNEFELAVRQRTDLLTRVRFGEPPAPRATERMLDDERATRRDRGSESHRDRATGRPGPDGR